MVLKAYMWKALEVHERINCINECLVEAFDKADALDVKYGGKPNKPPLFGLPFSVKGNFFVSLCDSISNIPFF
jgi:fatty acid amide hydrolase